MQHNGWQKAETIMTKENLSGKFKFLWKIQLGSAPGKDSAAYSEPLLVPRLINAKGFKDFVLWADGQNLYGVDSELGTTLWTKHFDTPPSPCGVSNLSAVAEAPIVINFRARRAAGAPPPRPQPPLRVSERRVGVSAGGGGFGLKGIYVLTSDGSLHEQVVATGADFAPPAKFLPGPTGASSGITLNGTTMFSATHSGCGNSENAVLALDMSSPDYPVAAYKTGSVAPLVAMGPTISDDVAYVVTGERMGTAVPNDKAAILRRLDAATPIDQQTIARVIDAILADKAGVSPNPADNLPDVRLLTKMFETLLRVADKLPPDRRAATLAQSLPAALRAIEGDWIISEDETERGDELPLDDQRRA